MRRALMWLVLVCLALGASAPAEDDVCSVCMGDEEDGTAVRAVMKCEQCGKFFACLMCYNNLLKIDLAMSKWPECPLCRFKLPTTEEYRSAFNSKCAEDRDNVRLACLNTVCQAVLPIVIAIMVICYGPRP